MGNDDDDDVFDVRVVTFNTFTAVPEPIRFNGQSTRIVQVADLLSRLERGRVDVFVLCECMLPSTHRDVFDRLAARGWSHVTHSLVNTDLLPSVVSGGVYIVSRWPIVEQRQHIFHASCMPDTLAAKGVVYARLRRNDDEPTDDIHVLGTHLQAWDELEQRQIRMDQAREIHTFETFLKAEDASRADGVWLLAGDFNVCPFTQASDFAELLRLTDYECPKLVRDRRPADAHPDEHSDAFRFSVTRHNHLVGLDDPVRYRTREWPKGCESIYLDTLRCECAEDKWLDFVCVSRSSIGRITDRCELQVCPARVPTYSLQMNFTTNRYVNYISDHHPVVARFGIAKPAAASSPASRLSSRFFRVVEDGDDRSLSPTSNHRNYKDLQTAKRNRHRVIQVGVLVSVCVLALVVAALYYLWTHRSK